MRTPSTQIPEKKFLMSLLCKNFFRNTDLFFLETAVIFAANGSEVNRKMMKKERKRQRNKIKDKLKLEKEMKHIEENEDREEKELSTDGEHGRALPAEAQERLRRIAKQLAA